MSSSSKVCFKELMDTYNKGIKIPEIQRDYVMGAGGKKEGSDDDKLTALLDAMLDASRSKKDFDFSCIITYCKDNDPNNHRLEIYDGQQRLTTLMIMILVCLQRECGNFAEYKEKYLFCERPIANSIIEKLTDERFNIEKIQVSDFTSFSMKHLISVFSEDKYNEITSEYLMKHVKFDRVELGSQSEIEQLFMDLNAGVKLKSYELYKAKLVHHINELSKNCNIQKEEMEILERWPHKLDNEWLDTFNVFSSFSHPAEEYEIAFLKYCFSMLRRLSSSEVEIDSISENEVEIDSISENELIECYDIMEGVSKLNFLLIGKKDIKPHMIEFAWGNNDECAKDYERRGAYWNLKFDDNEYHLYYIIKNVLLDSENNKGLQEDAVIWAYITSVGWQWDYQSEYIRVLKILLNHVFETNKEAWYECQNKGQYLYYSKYTVSKIPGYYGKHLICEDKGENKSLRDCIWNIIEAFRIQKPGWEKNLNRGSISYQIINAMINFFGEDSRNRIRVTLEELKENRDNGNYMDVLGLENETNGICTEARCDYYIASVFFRWPSNGRNNGRIIIQKEEKEVMVLLKCRMDKIYEEYMCKDSLEYNSNSDKISKFIQNHNVDFLFDVDKSSWVKNNFDVEKCFWIKDNFNVAYMIHDRQTAASQTYANYGGSPEHYWAYRFEMVRMQEVNYVFDES